MDEQKPEAQATETTQETPMPPTTTKKKKTNLWLVLGLIAGVLLLGFVGFIAAIVMLVSTVAKDAVLVSDKVVVATINNQPDALYGLTGQTFRDETTRDDVVAVLEQISPVLANGDFVVINKSVSKDSGQNEMATIDYKITTKQGTIYMRVLVEKEADGWKMVNFETQETPFESTSN